MNAHEFFDIAPDDIPDPAVCAESPGLTDLERNIVIVAHYVSAISFVQVNNVREIQSVLLWWLISRRTKCFIKADISVSICTSVLLADIDSHVSFAHVVTI